MGYSARDGIVKVSTTTVAEIRSYNISEEAGTAEDSVLGDVWDTHKATSLKWSGSAGMFWDPASAGQLALTNGATITLNLYPLGQATSAVYRTGSALVTGLNLAGEHKGLVEYNLTFLGSGPLAFATV